MPTAFGIGTYVGDTFGFSGTTLVFPLGAMGVFFPVGTMTFAGTTLAALGIDSLNNHLAFQGNDNVAGSQQIFVTTIAPSAVPEPAGAATALVCCVSGLLIRTRQRRRI